MSVQEIALSHNQRKKLRKAITDDNVLFEDDNGDLVLSMAAYRALNGDSPIEDLIGDNVLNNDDEFVIFS
ncbi:hypothetical protein [Dasania marina]|uniref:hypothetical protein n=1 Tax=Dasania marina TaxID=471499 RepID=UPI0030DB039C|tara:strand:- start:70786 stop:70995 length:210 start_codon:yes stop_codon:yes gene_type:complete